MRIQLFSKGPIDQVSGGFLYNRHIVDYLGRHGIDVSYHDDPADLAQVHPDAIPVIDSLIIADSLHLLSAVPVRPVLLMHMFPRAAEFATLLTTSRIITTGVETARQLRDMVSSTKYDIVVIEPGVPAEWVFKKNYAPSASRLLCLASYLPGKGHGHLLDVLHELTYLPWTLQMYGNEDLDAKYARTVRQKIHDLGLQDRVSMSAPVPHGEINQLMIDADLLLQFSEHESYSIVTAEAIACGLPVLSSRTGNWEHFSRSGLVRYLDAPAESASALGALVEDESSYARLRPAEIRMHRTWDDVGRDFVEWL